MLSFSARDLFHFTLRALPIVYIDDFAKPNLIFLGHFLQVGRFRTADGRQNCANSQEDSYEVPYAVHADLLHFGEINRASVTFP